MGQAVGRDICRGGGLADLLARRSPQAGSPDIDLRYWPVDCCGRGVRTSSTDSLPPPPLLDRYIIAIGGTVQWLGAMPDLIALGAATLLLAPAMTRQGGNHDAVRVMISVLLSWTVFLLLNPLVTSGVAFFTPRYYIRDLAAHSCRTCDLSFLQVSGARRRCGIGVDCRLCH